MREFQPGAGISLRARPTLEAVAPRTTTPCPTRASVDGVQGFVSCPLTVRCRGISLHAPPAEWICAAHHTPCTPSFSGASGCHRQVSAPHWCENVASAIEHRAGIEPAAPTWKEGRLPLPHRCIINLVEVSGFHPGNEHCPVAGAELHHRIWALRVADPHLAMFMCHLSAAVRFAGTWPVPRHLHASAGFAAAGCFPLHLYALPAVALAGRSPHVTFHEGHAGFEPTMPPWQGDVLPTTPVARCDPYRIRTGILHLDRVLLHR